jgi:HEPN domain-containing protein
VNEETVRAWCRKAENDLKAGSDELLTADPATDTVCFHMQQCVEKYLKAFLVMHGREIPRTHNIALVLAQCIEIDRDFQQLQTDGADTLSVYAVALRYPDEFYMPTVEETREALRVARLVKAFVGARLSPVHSAPGAADSAN